MELPVFLQRQGINVIKTYTKPSEACHEFLMNRGMQDFEGYFQELLDLGEVVLAGDFKHEVVAYKIKDGKTVIKEPLDTVDTTNLLIEKYYRFVEYLKREAKFDNWFNRVRLKWGIPKDSMTGFFYSLSNGISYLYLPYVVQHQDLIDDIGLLCKKVKLRPNVGEEFWVVAAYLLFGEQLFVETGNMIFAYNDSWRIFLVEVENKFKVYVELKPSLDTYDWKFLYEITKPYTKEDLFLPSVDGIINANQLFYEDNCIELQGVSVFAIPRTYENLDDWLTEYANVRKELNSKYGKNYRPREKAISEISKETVETFKCVEKSKGLKNKKAKLVCTTELVMERFGDKIDENQPYSENAVSQLLHREKKSSTFVKEKLCVKKLYKKKVIMSSGVPPGDILC